MKHRILALLALLLVLLGIGGSAAIATAQDTEEEERGFFIEFVEGRLSTPNRQIRLGAIEGALSSNVHLSFISISDREGEWLRIENVSLVWSRLALFTGRLQIDSLTADRIVIPRAPVPDDTLSPTAFTFQVPDLPVEVSIDRISVPEVELGAALFGAAATLSVDGGGHLEDGNLDAHLDIQRLDVPGSLTLGIGFRNASGQLDLDLDYSEPANGVVANLLNIPGRPALEFGISGSGPLDNFLADIGLYSGGDPLLAGVVTISDTGAGYHLVADVQGSIDRLVPAQLAQYFGADSRLSIDATRGDDGAIAIDELELASGVLSVTGRVNLAPDLFPTFIDVNGHLGTGTGEPVPLPGSGGTGTVRNADFSLALGGANGDTWSAEFVVDDLATATLDVDQLRVTAGGLATVSADEGDRQFTFDLDGGVSGLMWGSPAIDAALGPDVTIAIEGGSWRSGAPVTIGAARITTPNIAATFAGTLDGAGAHGTYRLAAADIAPFSQLAGRDLAGSADLSATGDIAFIGGGFDVDFDAAATDLGIDLAPVDALLGGTTMLSGAAARTPEGLRFDDLTLANPQVSARIDGSYAPASVDLTLSASIADIGLVTDRASGAATLAATLTGSPDILAIDASLDAPSLRLLDRTLEAAEARFNGNIAGAMVTGEVSVTGSFEGLPLAVSGTIERLVDGTAGLRDLAARIGETLASGSLTLRTDGLLEGSLAVSSPDIAAVAPLFLIEASGEISANVDLAVDEAGEQSALVNGTLTGFSYNGIRIGAAVMDLAGERLFSVPALSGHIDARDVVVGAFEVAALTATATRAGDATAFDLTADLAQGALAAAGSLAPAEGGLEMALDALTLTGGPIEARLIDATTVRVANGAVSIDPARLDIGGGTVTIGGTVGDTIDLDAEITQFPLGVVNAVAPGFEVGGTVSGALHASGTTASPVIDFTLDGQGIGAAALRELGIGLIDVSAAGRFADQVLTLDAATTIDGGRLTASGTLGLGGDSPALDLDLAVNGLPLAITNVALPDLGLEGTLSGTALVSGTLAAPAATFDLSASAVSLAVLRAAGVGPISATARGTLANDVLEVTAAASVGAGRLTAAGTLGLAGDAPLAFDVTASDLPLGLVNAFAPDLGLAGTLDGTARLTGTVSAPRVDLDAGASGVSAPVLRQAGIAPFAVDLTGTLADNRVTLDAGATIAGGRVRAGGTIGLALPGRLDLDIRLDGLALDVANAIAPNLGLTGAASGTASITGSFAAPVIGFDVQATGVSLAATRAVGIGPFGISVAGELANGSIGFSGTLGGSGIGLTLDGDVPLSGGGLDVRANGSVPLAAVDTLLATRGARAEGTLAVDMRVTGSLANPSLGGTIAADNARFVDPETGIDLTAITLRANLAGDSVSITTLTAMSGGGTIAAAGSIGLLQPGIPANLTLTARNAGYDDGELIAVTFDADLTVTGPLATRPLVAGIVRVARAEITVPDRFGGGVQTIDVTHVAPPPAVADTLRRAGLSETAGADDGPPPFSVLFDVTVEAPARIFVRGRGLDAELGGTVRVTGPIEAVQPVGSFELIRGRFDILGQRIEFDRGSLTLIGDLNPYIDFAATARSGEITVMATVTGRVSDPVIAFTSTPELPQDEVLSQLLFGRSINDLSPLQIANLAAAAASLFGGGGEDFLSQIRRQIGLDDLDVVTDESGNVAVQAGRYINENIYLGVRGGTSPEATAVTINLDVTDDITVRGEVNGRGETSVGVFYEHEF